MSESETIEKPDTKSIKISGITNAEEKGSEMLLPIAVNDTIFKEEPSIESSKNLQ